MFTVLDITDNNSTIMLEWNQSNSVAIENNVAIPYGTAESMKFVKRMGLVVLTYPDSIDWEARKSD